jgi:hypothetical protein
MDLLKYRPRADRWERAAVAAARNYTLWRRRRLLAVGPERGPCRVSLFQARAARRDIGGASPPADARGDHLERPPLVIIGFDPAADHFPNPRLPARPR